MAISIILLDYKNTKEGKRLLEYKNTKLISKQIKQTKFIKPNIKSIIDTYILSIKDQEDILIFLDSPYELVNIIFLFIPLIKKIFKRDKKIFQSYISSRGSIPLSGAKKYFIKTIYWKLFAASNRIFNYKLISSSSYEANQINIFFKGQKGKINFVIPDILFHRQYFIETEKTINRIIQSSKNKNEINNFDKSKTIRILIPSRTSKEKGVFELVNIISKNNNTKCKYKYEFEFCCNFEELNIKEIINNQFISLKFSGWMGINDFLNNLSNKDLVIIPSLYESFSIAAYQSLLFGKGIIISKNSPWRFISEKHSELPITLCNPLLRNMSFEKLIKIINHTYEFKQKKVTSKQLNKYLEEEARIFNYYKN